MVALVVALGVRRSHNRLRAAALLPRFGQAAMASSANNLVAKNRRWRYPMHYSQSPPLADKEWPTAEARARDDMSDQRIGIRPMKPSIDPLRSSRDNKISSGRPSFGRTLTRFLIAVLIGVGGTLAWQSHSDAAREMVVSRVPTLAWLLSVSTTKSPAAAVIVPDPVQQLQPLASNLDVVRRSVDQLAAKQEQMVQNIAALQAVEEDIRQKMSSPPPSASQQAVSIPPPHKPPQPRAQSSAVQSSSAPRPPGPAGPLVPSR